MNDAVGSRYVLPDLPWNPVSLQPQCLAEMLIAHHDQHHAAHVDRANRALDQVDGARLRRDWPMVNQLETEIAINLSEHALHSIFWTNIGPATGEPPRGNLRIAIEECFGNVDTLYERFTRVAGAACEGGWTTLAWDPIGRQLVIERIHDDHSIAIDSARRLLVCDMWRHAYAMQYGQDRARWLQAFWEIIDWRNVEERLIAQVDDLVLEPYAAPLFGCSMPV